MSDRERYMKIGEAAEILGLHPDTVRAYFDAVPPRKILGVRLPSGHRMVERESVERLRAELYPETRA